MTFTWKICMNRSLFAILILSLHYPPASGAELEGARVAPYFGYEKAVHLSSGPITVVLCPEIGGRVLEYAIHGKNVLYLSDAEKNWKKGDRPESSAGRFDIGPELVIPPRPKLWNDAWSVEIVAYRHVRLTSPDDASTGVRLVRDFVLDGESSRLSCTQTIHNISDKPIEWCHWSRTFAVGRGICLIPLTNPGRFPMSYVMYEEGTVINMKPEDPNIRVRDGFLEILGPPRKPKLGMDSYAGIIAYLAPNDLLFVKRFKTYPDRVYNEAAGLTISVWYPDREMIELEPIGPRERLQPGEHAGFTEEWFLSEMTFAQSREVDLQSLKKALP
jgi:hypothetical protein